MLAVPATGEEDEKLPAPWVLLVETDQSKLAAAALAWEEAGFGVEFASSVQNALECLAVMTPTLVVVDGTPYWLPPPPGAGKAHRQA